VDSRRWQLSKDISTLFSLNRPASAIGYEAEAVVEDF
jgi:hypothetical protein